MKRPIRGSGLRRRRERAGWTQADLAERLGTDPVTVSRWERRVSEPRPGAQVRLREIFGSVPERKITGLVRVLGIAAAERALERCLLLAQPATEPRFAADPTTRLREVDRARAEQLDLKRRSRVAARA